MAGTDKAMAAFRGRPLISHAVGLLGPQVAHLGLSVHTCDVRLPALDLPLIPDAPSTERQGPMAGIAAALAWASGLAGVAWCVTVPVDSPLLPNDLAARLRDAALSSAARSAHLRTPSGDEPLIAIWATTCATESRRYLTSGGRSVALFHRQLGSACLEGEVRWATNLNSLADITASEANLVEE